MEMKMATVIDAIGIYVKGWYRELKTSAKQFYRIIEFRTKYCPNMLVLRHNIET